MLVDLKQSLPGSFLSYFHIYAHTHTIHNFASRMSQKVRRRHIIFSKNLLKSKHRPPKYRRSIYPVSKPIKIEWVRVRVNSKNMVSRKRS